jgi:cell division protein FtsN
VVADSVASSAGGPAVQLGALPSQRAAERAWRKISNAEPALFTGKSPDIVRASVHGKDYYRLRVTGFDDKLSAAKFCAELSAAGSACTLANF